MLKEAMGEPMTDEQLSVRAGKDRNFSAIIKEVSEDTYDKMKEIGIQEYIDESKRLRILALDIYNDIEQNRSLFQFYEKYCKDIISSIGLFYGLIFNEKFKHEDSIMSIISFNKLTELKKRYDKYKKDKK